MIRYNSTNIYRIWNPLTGRVIVIRDVIFNEDQLFSRDIQELKDDLCTISADDLNTILNSIETIQSDELDSTTQNEDEELFVAEGDALCVEEYDCEEGIQESEENI